VPARPFTIPCRQGVLLHKQKGAGRDFDNELPLAGHLKFNHGAGCCCWPMCEWREESQTKAKANVSSCFSFHVFGFSLLSFSYLATIFLPSLHTPHLNSFHFRSPPHPTPPSLPPFPLLHHNPTYPCCCNCLCKAFKYSATFFFSKYGKSTPPPAPPCPPPPC